MKSNHNRKLEFKQKKSKFLDDFSYKKSKYTFLYCKFYSFELPNVYILEQSLHVDYGQSGRTRSLNGKS